MHTKRYKNPGPVAFHQTMGHPKWKNCSASEAKKLCTPWLFSTGFTYCIIMNTLLNLYNISRYITAANTRLTFDTKEIWPIKSLTLLQHYSNRCPRPIYKHYYATHNQLQKLEDLYLQSFMGFWFNVILIDNSENLYLNEWNLYKGSLAMKRQGHGIESFSIYTALHQILTSSKYQDSLPIFIILKLNYNLAPRI